MYIFTCYKDNTLYSQYIIVSIKVPTPITTMKISSKRVSMSVQLIFLTSAHTKKKETIF